jgi:hypothetical protein
VALAILLLNSADLSFSPDQLTSALPLIRVWHDRQAQARLHLGEVPYDLLQAADALLPSEATVLLVTSGADVRHLEYTTFHRALYILTPRPVWWVTPAPSDGTWESRWWISAPLSAASIRSQAQAVHATHVLVFGLDQPPNVGGHTVRLRNGHLITLDQGPTSAVAGPRRASSIGGLWPLQLALALGAIALLGHGLLTLLPHGTRSMTGIEALSLAWVIGGLLISVGMFWLNALGATLSWQAILLTAAALALSLRVARSRRPGPSEAKKASSGADRPAGRWAATLSRVLLLIVALQVGRVAVLAVGRPLTDWDSWAVWGMKARSIFFDSSLTPSTYADASRLSTNPYYPPHLPLLEAWVYAWLGAPDDRLVGSLAVGYHLALAGLGYSATRRWGASRSLGLLAAAVLLSIPALVRTATSLSADLPLAVFALTAGVYLSDYLEEGAAGSLALAALSAGALPWIKREGWLLLAALLLAAVISRPRARRQWRGVGAGLLMAGLIAGPWWWLMLHQGPVNVDFLPVSAGEFLVNSHRLPSIALRIIQIVLDPGWALLWPVFAAAVLAFGAKARFASQTSQARGRAPAATLWLPSTIVLYLTLLGLAYVFSDYQPFEQHVLSSFYRLVAQVAPLTVLWLVVAWLPRRPEGLRRPQGQTA